MRPSGTSGSANTRQKGRSLSNKASSARKKPTSNGDSLENSEDFSAEQMALYKVMRTQLAARKKAATAAQDEGTSIFNSRRLLWFIVNFSAIRMKNQSLINGEEMSFDEDAPLEDNEVDGRPAKRARTGGVTLDSEETAFASSLPPLRRTPGPMSRYNSAEDQDGDGDGGESRDEPHGDLETQDGDGNDENDQGVGFQDNGVCSQFF